MTEEIWRPLGVDTEEEIAAYDVLHDGVPEWMAPQFWEWIKQEIKIVVSSKNLYSDPIRVECIEIKFVECMCQILQITLPNLRINGYIQPKGGRRQIETALETLRNSNKPLQIADYILAHQDSARSEELEQLLDRSKSAWTVGTRSGKKGLVLRVQLGVQKGVDEVVNRAERAGKRLAQAWEYLYGLEPKPSTAYSFAIKAVEDVAVPVVSPKNKQATLGTVISDMKQQKGWCLPMGREDNSAPSFDVILSMIKLLWRGQHDRHGGQPSAPGNVSFEEAAVAVGLATTLVHWFDAGVVVQTDETS